jgi:hypothetical protein
MAGVEMTTSIEETTAIDSPLRLPVTDPPTRRELVARQRRPRPGIWQTAPAQAAIATGSRVLVGLLVARFALSVFPLRGFPLRVVPHTTAGPWWNGFFSWDAQFYKLIATSGYPASAPQRASYSPLYPEIVHFVMRVTTMSEQPSALLVGWTALFFATWGLIRLSRNLLPGAESWRAAWLFCWFPASVFIVAGYAESTFAALFVWMLVALSERRPWLAAVAASLAGITRPEGPLLVVAVIVWSLTQPTRRYARAVALTIVSEIGPALWTLFLWARYGNPFEEFYVQKYWQRHATWPFHTLIWSLGRIISGVGSKAPGNTAATMLLDDGAIVAGAIGLVLLARWSWQRRELWWVVAPVVALLALIVSNGPSGESPEVAARNVLCLMPLYLLPCMIKRRQLWTILLVASVALAILFQMVFNLGGWLT